MQSRLPLSVAIITLNEEQHLPRCLASVRELASEIVVVDSGSVDKTKAIAVEFGARFSVETWEGHVAQKNKALAACTQPWVLDLDADEAVSPELANSIRELLSGKLPEPSRGSAGRNPPPVRPPPPWNLWNPTPHFPPFHLGVSRPPSIPGMLA